MWRVNIVLLVLFKFSLLCQFEVKRADNISEMRKGDKFGPCDCIPAHGDTLHNCMHMCDTMYPPDTIPQCFWKCENKSAVNSKEVRVCYCDGSSSGRGARCHSYQKQWMHRDKLGHRCCRVGGNDSVCIGEPRKLDYLVRLQKKLCAFDKRGSNPPRLDMLCRIATTYREFGKKGMKLNGFMAEVQLRIADYLNYVVTTTTPVTNTTTPSSTTYRLTTRFMAEVQMRIADYLNYVITTTTPVTNTTTPSSTTGTTPRKPSPVTPRDGGSKSDCAECLSMYPRLPLWSVAVAGATGLIIGFMLAICVSRCFVKKIAEREVKQAARRGSITGNSSGSYTTNIHSRAPLMGTVSDTSTVSPRQNRSSTTDSIDLYDRRRMVAVSNTSAEFHQYESLSRLGVLPVTRKESVRWVKGSNHVSESELGRLSSARAEEHDYFALEDIGNTASPRKVPSVGDTSLKPPSVDSIPRKHSTTSETHSYLQVIDDSEQDGCPDERRHSNVNSRNIPHEYFELETLAINNENGAIET